MPQKNKDIIDINRKFGLATATNDHSKQGERLYMNNNTTTYRGPSWPWSYGSWIYNYICNRCPSPLMLSVRMPFVVRCTRYNIMW